MNIQYPHITGGTPEQQIQQLVSYLRQLADQLNYVLPRETMPEGYVQPYKPTETTIKAKEE